MNYEKNWSNTTITMQQKAIALYESRMHKKAILDNVPTLEFLEFSFENLFHIFS